jgi:hypothetical protein
MVKNVVRIFGAFLLAMISTSAIVAISVVLNPNATFHGLPFGQFVDARDVTYTEPASLYKNIAIHFLFWIFVLFAVKTWRRRKQNAR